MAPRPDLALRVGAALSFGQTIVEAATALSINQASIHIPIPQLTDYTTLVFATISSSYYQHLRILRNPTTIFAIWSSAIGAS